MNPIPKKAANAPMNCEVVALLIYVAVPSELEIENSPGIVIRTPHRHLPAEITADTNIQTKNRNHSTRQTIFFFVFVFILLPAQSYLGYLIFPTF